MFGFLRETKEAAKKAGKDKDTGLCRTGLEEYLEVIFPKTKDWVHNKKIDGSSRNFRPDYRSESLKLIIEFDGLPHYQNPDIIQKDEEKTEFYIKLGYRVIRIPYFIQLSNAVVKQMFNVNCKTHLFDENIPSLGIKGRSSPAYLCPAGLERMAKEFLKYPKQYKVNVKKLKAANNEYLTGVKFLEQKYNELKNQKKEEK